MLYFYALYIHKRSNVFHMTYRLSSQTGDSLPVPQIVFNSLTRAGGEFVRVALYILATHSTDPKDIAHQLNLKNPQAAQKALDFWFGAGLLETEQSVPIPEALPDRKAPLSADELRLAALRDPVVSMLATEAQNYLGKALGQKDIQRLVSLYVNESIPPEVILLCAAHLAGQGKHSVGQLERELDRWAEAGVTSGEEADAYLLLLKQRGQHEEAAAALLGLTAADLTMADRRCVRRWYEEYKYGDAMVEEAVLHAGANKEAKYINGILKSWHAKGWRTPADARGAGQLEGSNIRVDRAVPSGNDILQRGTRRPLRLKRED